MDQTTTESDFYRMVKDQRKWRTSLCRVVQCVFAMGCDLTVVVEGDVRPRILQYLRWFLGAVIDELGLLSLIADYFGTWRAFPIDRDYIDRSYSLFGLLAGVRGRPVRGYTVAPVDRVGLPRDASDEARQIVADNCGGYEHATWVTLDEADPSTNEELRRRFYGQWPASYASLRFNRPALGHRPFSTDWLELVDEAAQYQQANGCPVRIVLIFVS